MIIASRTREGEPCCCPLCRFRFLVRQASLFGDVACNNCGARLWHLKIPGERIVCEYNSALLTRERAASLLAKLLEVDRNCIPTQFEVGEFGTDSLDVVELAMQLEAELEKS